MDVLARVERRIRSEALIEPGGEITCLVSGGADSTCLLLALRELGYRTHAVHVNYGLRGDESEADAEHWAVELGAPVIRVHPQRATEDELRRLRYDATAGVLRATGHTANDQVETIIYRLASSGRPTGINSRREDGVVRPLLDIWRDETETFCRERGIEVRTDSSNEHTVRGPGAAPQIRDQRHQLGVGLDLRRHGDEAIGDPARLTHHGGWRGRAVAGPGQRRTGEATHEDGDHHPADVEHA